MSFYLIIRGPLGSGKSTISERLADHLRAECISIDRLVDSLPEDLEDGYISQKNFIKANKLAVIEANKFLEKNIPVIFDGNFYWQSQIDDLQDRLTAPHMIFTLVAPLEVCIERDQARDKTHGPEAAEAVYKKSTSFTVGTTIDVTQPLEQCLEEIVKTIPRDWLLNNELSLI